MARYIATHGALFPKEHAQEYGEYLNDALPRKLGRAPTTEEIVEDARRSRSCPYRDYFEWDQRKGHELYLLVQARNLVNHIAQITVIEGERKVCRAFFPIREEKYRKKLWVPLAQVRKDPMLMEHVIQASYRELRNWQDRYQIYNSLREATSLVSRALRSIKIRERRAPKD